MLQHNILKTSWDQKKSKQYILNLLEKVFKILKSLAVKLNLLKFVWKWSPRVQFGSSDDVIKVLLPLSVFLSHPRHQQQFVSIRFPPHRHSLCLPFGDVKQRRCHRPIPELWFYIFYTFMILCCWLLRAVEHRKVGEWGWYKQTSVSFDIFYI